MAKTDYIQGKDDAFNLQLQTFKNGIAPYSGLLGLTVAQTTAQAADAAYFDFTLKCLAVMSNGSQQWSAWKNLTRGGGAPPASGAPVAPIFPTTVTAVAPGIETRFRALVQIIKTNANYNASIGQALGIEGAEQTGPDLATVQPALDPIISGNHVNVKWGWAGNSKFLDMCEIQVDRGDGHSFVFLTYDTTPNYTDTAALPAAPAKWTYRAIFRKGDAQVGVWSAPVSVTVGG